VSSSWARVIVALAAIPFFIAAIIYGGVYFFALVEGMIILGVIEAFTLSELKATSPQSLFGIAFATAFCILFFYGKINFILPGVFLFLIILLTIELFRNKGSALLNVSVTFFSVLYVSFLMGSLLMLRAMPGFAGPQLVFLVFAGIWGCDTLAYYGGKWLGKHKLFERVSQKKTWEGAATGFLGALAGAVVIKLAYEQFHITFSLSWIQTLSIGAVAGTFGQFGDLAESLLKRDAQVKDSGSMLPGHGGILDRFDSLMFVAPVVYLYVYFFVF
jgi:phosphatidate cytidylyltransferase